MKNRKNKDPIPKNAVGVFTWNDCETCFCLIQAKEDIEITRGPVKVVLAREPGRRSGIRLTMRNAPDDSPE